MLEAKENFDQIEEAWYTRAQECVSKTFKKGAPW